MAQHKHNKPCSHRHSDLWWPSKAHKPLTDSLQFVDLHLQKGLKGVAHRMRSTAPRRVASRTTQGIAHQTRTFYTGELNFESTSELQDG